MKSKNFILILLSLLQLFSCEVVFISQIFRHTNRYPMLSFNISDSEYSGKPTFEGMKNSERRGENFYNEYKSFLNELKHSNIKNIISNNPRNFATIYFRIRGILKNTKLAENIHFHHFLRNSENEEMDLDFHNENFNKNLDSFLKNKENLMETLTNFFTKNFNTFIPSRTKDKFYFHHYQDKECYNTIIHKFENSEFMKSLIQFINELKEKHKDVLSKYYDYLHAEEHTIKDIDKRLVKGFSRHDYFKLMAISDFFAASYLSDLKDKMTEEEKNIYQDMHDYYLMTVRAGHYDGDIIELFSSKIFEEIIREIKGYVRQFKELKDSNSNGENNEIIQKINKKLLLVSSHDTYLSFHLYFLGINGNNYQYDYNDELSLVLHYDEERKELFLEIKYNDKRIVAEYCKKDPNRENICEFEDYLNFIEKRIHSEELLNKFCSGEIETFPAYQDRKSHLKDDL